MHHNEMGASKDQFHANSNLIFLIKKEHHLNSSTDRKANILIKNGYVSKPYIIRNVRTDTENRPTFISAASIFLSSVNRW